MDDAWLGLGVAVLVLLVLVAAVLYDLSGRGSRARAGDVSDTALRCARELDALHQPRVPPAGSFGP